MTRATFFSCLLSTQRKATQSNATNSTQSNTNTKQRNTTQSNIQECCGCESVYIRRSNLDEKNAICAPKMAHDQQTMPGNSIARYLNWHRGSPSVTGHPARQPPSITVSEIKTKGPRVFILLVFSVFFQYLSIFLVLFEGFSFTRFFQYFSIFQYFFI